MALKHKIKKEDWEKLSEELKAEYKESGDEYVLDVDGIEDTAALRRAKEREAQEAKEAKKRAKELEDKLAEIENNDARKSGDIDKLEKSWKEKIEAKEKEYQEKLSKLSKSLEEKLVDNVALEIATKISKSPKVILPHIKARLKADTEGEKPSTRVLDANGEISALSLEDLQKEFVANPDFADIMIGSKASGGAGQHSGGAEKFAIKTDDGKPKDLSKLPAREFAEALKAKKAAESEDS